MNFMNHEFLNPESLWIHCMRCLPADAMPCLRAALRCAALRCAA
jgi:hypothetical protein